MIQINKTSLPYVQNDATAVLVSTIDETSTSFDVSGSSIYLPENSYAFLTLEDSSHKDIVRVTDLSGDTFQFEWIDSTSTFDSGASVELRIVSEVTSYDRSNLIDVQDTLIQIFGNEDTSGLIEVAKSDVDNFLRITSVEIDDPNLIYVSHTLDSTSYKLELLENNISELWSIIDADYVGNLTFNLNANLTSDGTETFNDRSLSINVLNDRTDIYNKAVINLSELELRIPDKEYNPFNSIVDNGNNNTLTGIKIRKENSDSVGCITYSLVSTPPQFNWVLAPNNTNSLGILFYDVEDSTAESFQFEILSGTGAPANYKTSGKYISLNDSIGGFYNTVLDIEDNEINSSLFDSTSIIFYDGSSNPLFSYNTTDDKLIINSIETKSLYLVPSLSESNLWSNWVNIRHFEGKVVTDATIGEAEFPVYEFLPNELGVGQFIIGLPSWAMDSSTVRVTLNWAQDAATAGSVRWYTAIRADASGADMTGDGIFQISNIDGNGPDILNITHFDITGLYSANNLINVVIARDGTNVGDDFPGSAYLLGVNLELR